MSKRLVFLLAFLFSSHLLWADQTDPRVERRHSNTLTKSTPNIYQLNTKNGVAYQLQTAVGYITTIDLPEEARKVFVGDAEAFKVEVYGPQVIIKPVTDSPAARTNLIIYTKSQRLSFDIEIGPPATADFVLDFRIPGPEAQVQNEFKAQIDGKKQELETKYQEKKEKQEEEVKKISQKMLEEEIKKGGVVKQLKMSKKEGEIQINLLSLSDMGDKSYIRFSILNYSDHDYEIERVLLGKDKMIRKGFNLSKEGFIPVEFTQNLETVIPKDSYRYGLLTFPKVSLRENEHFTLKVYEKNNGKPWEITNIPVEAK